MERRAALDERLGHGDVVPSLERQVGRDVVLQRQEVGSPARGRLVTGPRRLDELLRLLPQLFEIHATSLPGPVSAVSGGEEIGLWVLRFPRWALPCPRTGCVLERTQHPTMIFSPLRRSLEHGNHSQHHDVARRLRRRAEPDARRPARRARRGPARVDRRARELARAARARGRREERRRRARPRDERPDRRVRHGPADVQRRRGPVGGRPERERLVGRRSALRRAGVRRDAPRTRAARPRNDDVHVRGRGRGGRTAGTEAAGDKDVQVSGGANVAQQALDAGLLDELHVQWRRRCSGCTSTSRRCCSAGVRLFDRPS